MRTPIFSTNPTNDEDQIIGQLPGYRMELWCDHNSPTQDVVDQLNTLRPPLVKGEIGSVLEGLEPGRFETLVSTDIPSDERIFVDVAVNASNTLFNDKIAESPGFISQYNDVTMIKLARCACDYADAALHEITKRLEAKAADDDGEHSTANKNSQQSS